jgi:hypothetical protein
MHESRIITTLFKAPARKETMQSSHQRLCVPTLSSFMLLCFLPKIYRPRQFIIPRG